MRPNRSLIGTNRFSANWDTWGFDDPRTQCGRDSALPLRGFFFASRVNRLLPKSGNIEGASTIMAPRKFSGPIQQGAIRVLRDMEVASTSDIMPITHPRQHNPQYRSRSLRRVLDQIAIRVGRAGGQGTPVLWRLKSEFRE